MINIERLSVNYGDTVVFEKANVFFDRGKCYGIIGFNGSGKTTLFETIYGFKHSKGKITLDGKKIKKKHIAYLPTENYFYHNLIGREYLKIFQNSNANDLISELESLFNVKLDEFILTYSSGAKKKLALMGIILLKREVYLLDEPFNNLDIESVIILIEFVKKIKASGKIIIISSHIVNLLNDFCDEIYYLEKKRINRMSKSIEEYYDQELRSKYARILKGIDL